MKHYFKPGDRVALIKRIGKSDRVLRIETIKSVTTSGQFINMTDGSRYSYRDYRFRLATPGDEKVFQGKRDHQQETTKRLEEDNKQRASLQSVFNLPVAVSSADENGKRTVELSLADADILRLARLLEEHKFNPA